MPPLSVPTSSLTVGSRDGLYASGPTTDWRQTGLILTGFSRPVRVRVAKAAHEAYARRPVPRLAVNTMTRKTMDLLSNFRTWLESQDWTTWFSAKTMAGE